MTTPYYADDQVTLYHGDCREVTEWLAADVLVTDPPYGTGWKQPDYLSPGRTPGQRSKPHDGIAGDRDTSARDDALALWEDKPALVFGAIRLPPADVREVIIWQKPADSGLFHTSTTWRRDWEPVFVIGRWPRVPASRSSVIRTRGTHRAYAQGIHPHGKPVSLMEQLIVACPDGVIADPFAGSGSTLVAARNLGRRAIGVELDERYAEIAAKRLCQGVLISGVLG